MKKLAVVETEVADSCPFWIRVGSLFRIWYTLDI